MKDYFKKNYIYFLLVLILIFIVITFFLSKNKQIKITQPQETPDIRIPAQGKGYQESVEIIRKNEAEQLKKDYVVGKLIEKLPYKGDNFSLGYSFDTLKFILSLTPGNEKQGNGEFDKFLLQNQIENRDWLKHLTIK